MLLFSFSTFPTFKHIFKSIKTSQIFKQTHTHTYPHTISNNSLYDSAKFSFNYLDIAITSGKCIRNSARNVDRTRNSNKLNAESTRAYTHSKTHTHTHPNSQRALKMAQSCSNRRRCTDNLAKCSLGEFGYSSVWVRHSSASILVFGFSKEGTIVGGGSRGVARAEAAMLPLAFLHFNCMSRRKVCNEVDTGPGRLKKLSSSCQGELSSKCDLHFEAVQMHLKFAANFVCFLAKRHKNTR